MKRTSKRTFRLMGTIVFCAILFSGLYLLNLLSYEPQVVTGQWNGWSNLPKNSVDILFLGNSHAECTVAPLQLFSETGITSWVLKSTSCNMPIRYYYLKEALKTQHPKLIALEVYTGLRGERLNDGENLIAYGQMPFSINRVEGASVTATPTVSPSFAVPLISGHDKLLKLDYANVNEKLLNGNNLPVSTAGANIVGQPKNPQSVKPVIPDAQPYPLPSEKDYAIQMKYLRKIAQLADDNGIKLLVWLAPTEFKNQSQYFSKIQDDISRDFKNVEYLEMNQYRSAIGLVPSDFSDPGHLYIWGQKKTTAWLGDYLHEGRVSQNASNSSWWKANLSYWHKVCRTSLMN